MVPMPMVAEKEKAKGGRHKASDPRDDPNICPKKAKRMVDNRRSAARSKVRKKEKGEQLQAYQQARLTKVKEWEGETKDEIQRVEELCAEMEAINICWVSKIQGNDAEEIQHMQKLCAEMEASNIREVSNIQKIEYTKDYQLYPGGVTVFMASLLV
eukprot:gene18785-25326_t